MRRPWDYEVQSPGTTLKTTQTDYWAFHNSYALANNMLDRPWSVTVTDGNTGQQTITTFGYDENGLESGNATSGWNSVPLAGVTRGNQTSIKRYWNTSGSYLTTTKTYTNTGLVHSITEPPDSSISPASTTTFDYSSGYDGAYLTKVTNALGQHSDSLLSKLADG